MQYQKLNRKDAARRSAIIRELSVLSRSGWRYATRQDWETLECELRALNDKMGSVYAVARPKAFEA